MSFGSPAIVAAITAPMTPSGTTRITAAGTDQLSYRAARQRNTTSTEIASSAGACDPDRDRKSVVEGQSVSVRVDLGGRRIIRKKINISLSMQHSMHITRH